MALLAGSVPVVPVVALVMNERALAAELTMKLRHFEISESLGGLTVQRGCWDKGGAAGAGLDIRMTGGSSESESASLRLV